MKYIVFFIFIFVLSLSVFAQTESLKISTVLTMGKVDIEDNAYLATDPDSRVGIGTTTPEFKLSLDDDGGIIAKGTLESGNSLTTAGAGVRMIWYPRKAAFRAGGISGEEWDDENIGNYSTAMGYRTIASGLESFATGHITTASGNYSTAMGGSTTASGMYATAFGGGGTTASGNYSTAMGRATYASGDDSTAMGALLAANGWCSVAMGYYVSADADQSVVIGRGYDTNNRLVNNIEKSMMVGFASNIPTLFVGPGAGAGTTGNVGIGTTSPEFKLDLDDDGGIIAKGTFGSGDTLTTSGTGTRLIWYPRKAAFRAGHLVDELGTGAEDESTRWDEDRIGNYSTAMGRNTAASGEASTAMGSNSVASGKRSTAMGSATKASGEYSTATGAATNAQGNYSFAAGRFAQALHEGCFVWADTTAGFPNYYESDGDDQFRIHASGGAFLDGASEWEDIAEFMDISKEEKVQEAEIVSLIGEDLLGKTKNACDSNLVGVISSDRTTTLNLGTTTPPEEGVERLPVALIGRCFVKVTNESGQIKIGDPVTSSSLPGIGMKATRTGKIIGYAMEEADFKKSRKDEILVFVNVGYYVSGEDYAKLNRIDRLEKEVEALKKAIR